MLKDIEKIRARIRKVEIDNVKITFSAKVAFAANRETSNFTLYEISNGSDLDSIKYLVLKGIRVVITFKIDDKIRSCRIIVDDLARSVKKEVLKFALDRVKHDPSKESNTWALVESQCGLLLPEIKHKISMAIRRKSYANQIQNWAKKDLRKRLKRRLQKLFTELHKYEYRGQDVMSIWKETERDFRTNQVVES